MLNPLFHRPFFQPVLAARRVLDRAGRRLRRARPGSVLILVIALLVLMALIGTAFISTARTDRYSSTTHTYNTQIDLLVEGATRLAQAPLVTKVQSTGVGFRTASSAANPTNPAGAQPYFPYESPILDSYLADRTPSLQDPSKPASPGNPPVWLYTSGALGGLPIDVPYGVDSQGNVLQVPLQISVSGGQNAWRNNLFPTYLTINQQGQPKTYPAFTLNLPGTLTAINPTTGAQVKATPPYTVLAADTDGDGIADALYVRLPVGQVEGATYFGAVRIIDNCGAVNAGVAMAPYQKGTDGGVPGDFFPTNIDLFHILLSGETLNGLNLYRFQNNGQWSNVPIDDSGNARPDYVFSTAAEAMWSQLGSRLNNPGANNGTGPQQRYQALPLQEGFGMAYHNGMINLIDPFTSILESQSTGLQQSLGIAGASSGGVLRGPYDPGDTVSWYNGMFNYLGGNMPLRSLLVVRNPVSNFAPSYFFDWGAPDPKSVFPKLSFKFGDRVLYPDPSTGQPRGFVCIQPNDGSPPVTNSGYNTVQWAYMPWANHPTKTNINTGTFGQLWTAFWSVMQDAPDASGAYPQKAGSGATPLDMSNRQFRSPFRYAGQNPYAASDPNNANTAPPNPLFTRSQGIQLRSALAAVNAIDMRDPDDDASSRTVLLTPTGPVPGGQPQVYRATVYGAEKQPYITEIMIEASPKDGESGPKVPYLIFEIYNPHSTPISLRNWKMGRLVRTGNAITSLTEVGDFTATLTKGAHNHSGGDVIMPGERIVIESDPTQQPRTLAPVFANANAPTVYQCLGANGSPGTLGSVSGSELILLRPRNATGDPSAGTFADNAFAEVSAGGQAGQPSTWNLAQMMPIDQIDLVGISDEFPDQDAPPRRYRYARANLVTADNNSAAWHCVYPGPYDSKQSGAGDRFHLAGLVHVGSGDPNDPVKPVNNGGFGNPKGKFGTGDPSTTASYETRPLQVNNRDMAGPNRTYQDSPNTPFSTPIPPQQWSANPFQYPAGGFIRNGDILNVPFIGAYTITDSNGKLIEMNSVTMDSVMAQFQDPAVTGPNQFSSSQYDIDSTTIPGVPFHQEQIGHFCPMDIAGPSGQMTMDDLDDPTSKDFMTNRNGWTYHFAKRLFDYLAVYTPQDDYLPNVDPAGTTYVDPNTNTAYIQSGDPTLPQSSSKYSGVNPAPVPNGPTVRTMQQANNGREETAGTEGLVNLNTANWKVLSTVPWYTTALGAPNTVPPSNIGMGQAIWQWRESVDSNGQHTNFGPFRSVFDLMKVPQFQSLNSQYLRGAPGEADYTVGAYSPYGPTMPKPPYATNAETNSVDHVVGGVKTRFLLLQRISNLVTVRSDSYTMYVQVQGWQNVGTPFPTLVAQRRTMAFVDRTQVKPVHDTSTSPPVSTPASTTVTPPGLVTAPNN